MERVEEIARLFPDFLRPLWQDALRRAEGLREIRLRMGRPALLRCGGSEWFLRKDGCGLTRKPQEGLCLREREIEAVWNHICGYSPYAYEDEIRQGYLTVPGGHRVGLAGQVVQEGRDAVRTIRHISGLNIRVSRQIFGAADGLLPYLYEERQFRNVMLISPPGCGKTTLLRDLIRQVSDGNRYGAGRTVGVVDERSELAGSYLGKAQNDLGMRTDVMDACPKALGMLLLLRSMSPDVIAVDELGGEADVRALEDAACSGVGLMVTVHGAGTEDIRRRAILQALLQKRLFDRFAVLTRTGGVCRIAAVYDGAFRPC